MHIEKLGSPLLRKQCRQVRQAEIEGLCDSSPGSSTLRSCFEDLAQALETFRYENGFGRAISAPQVGYPLSVVALNLGRGTFHILNPVIVHRSAETFTLWDDCMSLDDTMVRVRRNKSISIEYIDTNGVQQTWKNIDQATSELLQHELDHLKGVLAVDIAEGSDKIPCVISRRDFEAKKQHYLSFVDYVIESTLPVTSKL